MGNKSRYATKFYVVLMMLSLVSQLFVPFLQVAAVEVPTTVTQMTAKSTGDSAAELNLSLTNTSSDKKSEQIKLDSDVLMIPGVLKTLVSTEGKNVGTYQIKDRQIDVEINENVSAQVKIPIAFSATDTAATATFTNGQLKANVDVAAKQNKTSYSSTSSSEQKVTTSTSATSSISANSKGDADKKTDTKKSVTKATTQDEQANDISSYLPDSSKGTIIDKADVKFTDSSNNEVSASDVTADTNISLAYNWSIPSELKNGYEIKAGDYFEFKLPANITYRAGTGDLGEYGTYKIESNGTVRFTFNANIENGETVKGTFNYSQAKLNVTEPGQTTIDIPTTSGEQKVDVIVNPTGGNDIAKSGTVSPAKNPQSVNWQVDINTNGKTLNNAVIRDTLPDGLKLTGTQVYLLNIDLKGNVTGEGQQLTEGTDYTVSDNGTVTLIGNYAKTQQAFRIKYATDIEADAIPNDGGNVKFENNATLTNDSKDYSAQASVTASYGKLLDKQYNDKETGSQQKLNWTINYNAGDKKLPAGTVLTDNLSGAQEYIGTPKLIYTDGPNSGQEVKQDDYEITYNSDKTQMTIKFTSSLEQAVKITYQTQVNTPINGSTTINNSAESNGKTVTVGDKKVDEQGIAKSIGDVDYNAKTVIWNVRINQGQQEMTNWSAEDTIPDGLTLVDDESFVLKDVTTNKALVRGTDYQVTKTVTGFKIELSGAYKTTADEFLLTYKTNFDTEKLIGSKWTNTIAATWTDKNGDDHHNNGSADFKPKEEFVTDGTKSGSYNAVNKHITWTVVANYNQRELKNAKLVDTLTGDPEYVTDSAKLYEATINKNGSYTLGKQAETNIDYDKDSGTLTANLPENSNKAYVMIFETSLEGKVIDAPSYDNTAKYTNDGQDKDLTAKVSVPNTGKVAYKTGEQDPEDSAYAVWNITVNPEQSTLKDVTVVDKPSTNQVLNKSDVVVYGTKIAANGAITVDKDSVLTEGKDYSIDITTDQTSGEQVMTIKFLHEISTAYSVHYRTLINSSKINDTLNNAVTVTGNGQKEVTGEVTTSSNVVNNSGTAEGINLDYQLTKVDKDTGKVLSGVKFELWSYKNNAKGQILRTGTTDDEGQIRWNNLKSGKYVLVETAPADYQTVTDKIITLKADDANSDDLITSTITNEKVKTSVSGEKTWVDNNNQDGMRPSKITVSLLANGEQVATKEVTAADDWQYKFNDLDKFKAGQEIKYTVKEAAVTGYETTYDGTNITNTHKVEKTSVSGQKTWSDHDNQDGMRPSKITVSLLANGEQVATKEVTAANGWEYEFNDLDKFKDGQEIKYTVEEAAVTGYETTYDGTNITNTHKTEKTSVSGQKTWLDNDDQDGNRPDSIKLHLLANGKEVATKVVTAKDDWKYEFNDLDKYSAGKEIVYTITEDQVNDYSADVSDVKNIVNKYTPGKTNATVTKAWKDADNQDGLRKSIQVQLYANDKAYGDPVELTADTNWTYTWNDLNQRQGHKDVTYTVKEMNTPDGYASEVNNDNQGNLIITNTHKVAKISVSGQKTWADQDDQDGMRPKKITVNLLADGKKVASKTVTAKDGWQYKFNDLDKFKAGQEIKYTVEEASVDGYKTSYDGNNITNTHQVAKTAVSGYKTWQDNNNKNGQRPHKIVVNLLANGRKVASKTVTSDNDWHYKFTDLDQYRLGKKIKYSISEDKVAGYKTTVSGYDLTNTLYESQTPVKNQSSNQGTPKKHKHQGLLESILPATGVLKSKNFVVSGLVFILFVLSSIGYVLIKRRHND
ncbi:Cna B-type domain-containing protein [Weissella paramesenteroides]|uniref:Cna B-type domain-containing protein n=2 Tax=Weissella paramesenteroides TaxID=1249 RepID=UPI00140A3529|nr:Cna B-type domain-containing protein [Weissella paramesenteroides]